MIFMTGSRTTADRFEFLAGVITKPRRNSGPAPTGFVGWAMRRGGRVEDTRGHEFPPGFPGDAFAMATLTSREASEQKEA